MAKINRLATTGNLLPPPSFSALPAARLPVSGPWLNKVRQDCATNRGRDWGRSSGGQELQLRSLHCVVCWAVLGVYVCVCVLCLSVCVPCAVFWGVSLDGFLTLAHCCPAHSPVSAVLLATSAGSQLLLLLPAPAAAAAASSAPVAFPAELLFGEFRKLRPIAIVCSIIACDYAACSAVQFISCHQLQPQPQPPLEEETATIQQSSHLTTVRSQPCTVGSSDYL